MNLTLPPPPADPAADPAAVGGDAPRHPFLVALGERVRARRVQRGMTRKALSAAAGVSERHLANLEVGLGNASVLVLLQVAQALDCTPAALLDDGAPPAAAGRLAAAPPRVALIGLRGAGKSTLGRRLAEDLGHPFIELSREVERQAGCSTGEIQALYGAEAYRRHQRRALEHVLRTQAAAVIATPGGLVADDDSFSLLLARCTTVWLQAAPEDHMQRVRAQGDLRPMAASREAMADLRSILAARTPLYARAQIRVDTSAQPLEPTFALLRAAVRHALRLAA